MQLAEDIHSQQKLAIKFLARGTKIIKDADREICNLRMCALHPYIIRFKEVRSTLSANLLIAHTPFAAQSVLVCTQSHPGARLRVKATASCPSWPSTVSPCDACLAAHQVSDAINLIVQGKKDSAPYSTTKHSHAQAVCQHNSCKPRLECHAAPFSRLAATIWTI